MNHIIIFV